MTLIPLWPGMNYNRGPVAQVQPFSYQDDVTFLDLLYLIRNYVRDEVVPQFNGFGEEVEKAVNEIVTAVDDALVEQTTIVNDALTEQTADNAEKIATLTTFVNESVQSIIDNSVEVQDPVVADLVEAESLTASALNAKYPVYRAWVDGVGYPARNPNSVNIFFGPENPGLAMGVGDYWANSNVTTLDEVNSQVQIIGSLTNMAIRNAVGGANVLNFGATVLRQNPADAALFSLSARGSGGNQYLSWGIPGTGVSRLYADFIIPDGWSKMVAEVFYLHNVAAANGLDVTFTPSLTKYDSGMAIPAGSGVTFSDTSLNAGLLKMATSNSWDVTPRQSVSLMMSRNANAASDTHKNPIEIVRIRVRRTA